MFAKLAQLVEEGGVAVLSGAGLSTDSGIPDYRGDGVRLRRRPITYREFVADDAARRRYWARSHLGWLRVARAVPNRGHHAVAELETGGFLRGVITQNVDGLHQAAGGRKVNELHGSLHATICLQCGDRRSRLELHHRLEAANPRFRRRQVDHAPDGDAELTPEEAEVFVTVDCLDCGGVLKPDVVFFGEAVPRLRVDAAFDLLSGSAALLVLGSSLTVMSGYRFALAARRQGIALAVVNRGPTRADDLADIRIDAGLSETLTRLASGCRPRAKAG